MINIVHNADCLPAMREMKDNQFDLAITSPPYNLGNTHHTGNKRHNPYNDDMPENEYQEWQIEVLNELSRIIKGDGSIFYNHKNRIKQGEQITPYEWILKTNLIVKQELVWFNGSQNFDKCRFYPMTERVYWLSNSIETKFNNNINHHDLFDWKAEGINKNHTRMFPLIMVKNLLKCFPVGLKVIDPFSGSGQTRIACWEMGFDFEGWEIDKDYWLAQEKRFNTVKNQIKLF